MPGVDVLFISNERSSIVTWMAPECSIVSRGEPLFASSATANADFPASAQTLTPRQHALRYDGRAINDKGVNMKTFMCKTARNLFLKSIVASLAAAFSFDAAAQATPEDIEELVVYAQCIRANGYADFPDPGPDGRMMIRVTDPAAGQQFRAAQAACTDKLPSRMAAMNEPMTPERLEGLVKFAECVRAAGISGFPDPNPQGTFELTDPVVSPALPQVQQAMGTCRESTGVAGIRMIGRPPQ